MFADEDLLTYGGHEHGVLDIVVEHVRVADVLEREAPNPVDKPAVVGLHLAVGVPVVGLQTFAEPLDRQVFVIEQHGSSACLQWNRQE